MDDLISRQAAIEALGERPMVWTDDDQYALGERNQYDRDRLAIETLPSAQPERKKGRWTITPLFIKCSECGEAFMLMPQNYCPNCGVDMRGEENE